MSTRVHVVGASGRMGRAAVTAIAAARGLELAGTTGRDDDLAAALAEHAPDVVVEFTAPDAVERNLRAILDAGLHAVTGTTGLPAEVQEELGLVARSKGRGLVIAPNFALGVILMQRFAREAARHFRDVEIVELHHPGKKDAPSGTARHTARQIAAVEGPRLNQASAGGEEHLAGSRGGREAGIPLHAVRLPGLLAHQEVLFGGPGQLLTIRHDTTDRSAFMPGLLLAVRQVAAGAVTGLVDSLEPLLDLPDPRA